MTGSQERSIMIELQSSHLDYLSWVHSKPALKPPYDPYPHYSPLNTNPETHKVIAIVTSLIHLSPTPITGILCITL